MRLPQFDSVPGRWLYLVAFENLSNKRVAVRSIDIDEIENAAYSSSFPGLNVTLPQVLHALLENNVARTAPGLTFACPSRSTLTTTQLPAWTRTSPQRCGSWSCPV